MFDSSIDDDCSGYYGIMLHYVKAFVKQLDGEEEKQLIKQLTVLSRMIQLHLNHFNERHYFPSEFIDLVNIA